MEERKKTLKAAYKAVGGKSDDFDDQMCRRKYRKYVEETYAAGGTPVPYDQWKASNC